MLRIRSLRATRARGFSLVEMMISLVLGLVVIGAALVLVVSVVRANSQTVQATALTSELRAQLALVTKELQRARYMKDPVRNVGQAANANNPNDTIDDDGCVRFSYYDPDPDRDGSDADETNRAVSIGRVEVDGIGAIYMDFDADAAPLADATGLTDTTLAACPDATDIRLSSTALDVTRFCALLIDDGVDNAATQGCEDDTVEIAGALKDPWSLIKIAITGAMVGDASGLGIERTVSERLRIGSSRVLPDPPPAP